MNFDLSEEEAAVQQLAAQILGEATSFDRTRKVESDEAGPGFDVALWAQLAESNLIGLASPESLGGQGFGFLALCLLLEEAGRNLAPVPLLESVVYSLLPIQQFGNEQLQRDLLPKVISGETWLTAALSEIGVPTSARVVNTVLTKTKDGRYRLRGEKICVPFAAGAHRILGTGSAGSCSESLRSPRTLRTGVRPSDSRPRDPREAVAASTQPMAVLSRGLRVPRLQRLL